MCCRYAVKHICICHIATGQGACDVRDILPVVAYCGPGFDIIKWAVLKIKF
jgi:hypothetical protein